MQINAPLYSLNAGIASRYGLGRIDLARLRLAAEVQQNIMPRVLGPATFRPGTEYLTRTQDDEDCKLVPFVFNAETKALVEVSSAVARFIIDGVPLTRPTVTAVLTNAAFDADLTGWTSADEAGAVSDWISSQMQLLGTGTSFAIRYQALTINEIGTEHAIMLTVTRGPIIFSVGTSAGEDDVIAETVLRTGVHSIAFTPAVGQVYVQVKSDADAVRLITSIRVELAGIVTIPHPWGADFRSIRYEQSADVMFVACEDIHQQRIERRSQRSWSICDYNTLDGPFQAPNDSATTLASSAVVGNATLTASRSLFRGTMAGALFRLTHFGQSVANTLTGDDQFSDSVQVTGVSTPAESNTRPFFFTLIGLTGTGTTVTLQRSFGEEGSWDDVSTYTTDQETSFSDTFDNQIVFYRLGIKSGDYSSGSIEVLMAYTSGSQQGVVRITGVTSATSAQVEILSTLGSIDATTTWEEGEWSDYRGFPSAVAFHDGRLWWGWQGRVFGSVSDNFTSYDDSVEGDSGPVVRSVTAGPVEGIRWLLSLQRLLAGTTSQEISIRSNSFDEPITPTAFTARNFASRGCADLQAVEVDGRCIYVQRNEKRVYVAGVDANAQDYISTDLTRLVPDLLGGGGDAVGVGIVDIAVQRQPDTRVWFVLSDGTAAVLVFEPSDEVVAWSTIVTDGTISAVGVLPGEDEDEVYIAVQRTNSSGTIRAIERFATLTDVLGGDLSKTVDSFLVHDGVATAGMDGLEHLAGQSVRVWADGIPLPDAYTVDNSGILYLLAEYEKIVVGRSYDGKFQSSKLAAGAATGTAISKRKRVDHVALMMADVAWYGVRVGRNFDDMTRINPTLGNGRTLASTEVLADYDYEGSPFNGGFGPDERVCFTISSPYCATFMGVVMQQTTNDPAIYGTRPAGG